MANCLDYAKIASAVYNTGKTQYYEDPAGHMVDDWTVQKWETGSLLGDGFQGGIWQRGNDVVVGFCGTHLAQKYGKGVNDVLADLKIGLRILPNQCKSARHLVRAAKQIAKGRRVSVTGHSLGGGLAQVVGLWEQVPFATFNAPAMADVIKVAHFNFLNPFMMMRTWRSKRVKDTPGINFRVDGDLVSINGIAGNHVGMVVDLRKETKQNAHKAGNCWQGVLETDWANIDPFEAL